MTRHRHQEFIRILRMIDRNSPGGLDQHIIVDNYATHKHPKVKAWLARHKRFHLHFTPTSASWINQVERFFGLITDEAIRRGVFRSGTMPIPSLSPGPPRPPTSSKRSPVRNKRSNHSTSWIPRLRQAFCKWGRFPGDWLYGSRGRRAD
jgi:hypothetical protein